ncbi:sensor histidine kinase [Streptomyces sp. NPDC006879]|uniref:sensor histidine kinase n=1 Tax=Streptomyces sp. NPDC006879 TaxID=3364767 RepID=UPI0036C44D63
MFTISRPHPHDVIGATAGLAGGTLMWSLGLYMNPQPSLLPEWAALVPLVAMSGLDLLRRSRPRPALLLGTGLLIADQFTVGSLATVLLFTDLMHAGMVYGSPALARRLPIATALITVAVALAALVWLRRPEALQIGVVTGLVAFAPALSGAALRSHREAAAAASLRAEQTALLAEMDRSQAVMAERARMARELHDMVANHLSAIAIHSSAALSIDSPGTSREALSVIRTNSVEGLDEMRRLIGLLRETGGEREPAVAPSLAGLETLVAQARANGAASGVEVSLADERPEKTVLPAPVELAAYRIVQEALTNALKHAAPGLVRVRLACVEGSLEIGVDSPYGPRSGPRAPGSGAGLVGMRERVALLGGEFTASARTGDVWRVRASLPLGQKAGA